MVRVLPCPHSLAVVQTSITIIAHPTSAEMLCVPAVVKAASVSSSCFVFPLRHGVRAACSIQTLVGQAVAAPFLSNSTVVPLTFSTAQAVTLAGSLGGAFTVSSSMLQDIAASRTLLMGIVGLVGEPSKQAYITQLSSAFPAITAVIQDATSVSGRGGNLVQSHLTACLRVGQCAL